MDGFGHTHMQDFHDHWLVRPKITSMIYRLALHTSENTCPKARGLLVSLTCAVENREGETVELRETTKGTGPLNTSIFFGENQWLEDEHSIKFL